MAEEKMIRLSAAARELNKGVDTLAKKLADIGIKIEGNSANAKITFLQFEKLSDSLGTSISEDFKKTILNPSKKEETLLNQNTTAPIAVVEPQVQPQNTVLTEVEKTTIPTTNTTTFKEERTPEPTEKTTNTTITNTTDEEATTHKVGGLKVLGKIDLNPTTKTPNNKEKENQNQFKEKKPEEKREFYKNNNNNSNNNKNSNSNNYKDRKDNKNHQSNSNQSNRNQNQNPKPNHNPKPQENKYSNTPKVQPKQQPDVVVPKEKYHEKVEKPEKVEKEAIQPPIIETNLREKEVEIIDPTQETERIEAKAETLKGLTVLGKIDLPMEGKNKKGVTTTTSGKPVATSDTNESGDRPKKKRKKKKIQRVDIANPTAGGNATINNFRKDTGDTRQKQPFNRPNTQGNSQQQSTTPNTTQNTNTYRNSNSASNNISSTSNNNSSSNNNNNNNNRNNRKDSPQKVKQATPEITEKEIQNQIKKTLAELSGRKNTGKKFNKTNKREHIQEEDNSKILKLTEFISVSDLASLMNVSAIEVISSCMSMGLTVSINQRLDAEAITIIASEFGFDTAFINIEDESKTIEEEVDTDENLVTRAPIVTIMGHVDHGKTSLLDYIRHTNVIAKEAGGITQHIGAYDVVRPDGRRVVFLDTPGHEAFTAMRARGAKVTDIAIIVVAADDNVMPQTKEAISHARVADVPIVIAINKVDKPTADPEKIKQELSKENILVESWGGKYQDEPISAKKGTGIDNLLEKVLIEAELLELKANPNRKATGTIIESSLDKGKGYVCTVLVQNGTLRIGDIILVGSHYGRVKAMYDHFGTRVKQAPPSTPVQVLGLNGAPQAGDILKVMPNEREAREIASKREQILREQTIRATKGLTLDEIARRKALGDFKELKLIIKGDFDGSVEALTDSLLKLSTPEIAINIIHKGVGQITESDVQLAISAKDTIILGFQVRPSVNSKKLAEQNKIQIKLYSIIYQAIEEIKDAMSGMLAPKTEEVIVGNVEIRETFKISKVGTIAGCYVTEGYIKRNSSIRIIREGIVILQEGSIESLKRFKDDVSEVKHNYECGLNIKGFSDLKVGDTIEVFEIKEIKRTL